MEISGLHRFSDTARTNTARFFAPAVIAGAVLSGPIGAEPVKEEGLQTMARSLQAEMDTITRKRIVPGLTLSVRFKDGTHFSLASGLADVEGQIPMKPDAVMLAGSVGKTHVAAIVLKLWEQGKIDLEAKAGDYLGREGWFAKIPNAGEATVEMLLNHTAGIPDYVDKKALWKQIQKNPDREWTVEDRLADILTDAAVHAPGRGWAYSDSHYLLLGLIIEKITGRPYYDVLEELILKPCRLTRTFPSDRRTLPGLIPGYTAYMRKFLLPRKVVSDNRYAFNPQLEWTGGGLASTVSDLSSWVQQLYGGDVIKPETKKRMLTPAPYAIPYFEKLKYGLGCFIGETDGISYYGHNGFSPGYITYVQYLPQEEIALACQFNDDGAHDNNSMKRFFNKLKKLVIDNRRKPGASSTQKTKDKPWF